MIERAVVACGSCTLCCRSRELVLIGDNDVPPPGGYQLQTIEIAGRRFTALAMKPDGSCAHLTDTGCGIHEHAPEVCRAFDCAGFYAKTDRRHRRIESARDPYRKALYARGRELHRLQIGSQR